MKEKSRAYGLMEGLEDIGDPEFIIGNTKTKQYDLNRMLDSVSYDRPEHFTRVHVEGNIKYILYGGEEKIHPIDEVYEHLGEFFVVLQKQEKNRKTSAFVFMDARRRLYRCGL